MPSPLVARLRTLVPFSSGPFVVRGVVPCPVDWSEAQGGFGGLVAYYNGQGLPTQVSPARFDQRGRASAVEVCVQVPSASGLTVGAPLDLGLAEGFDSSAQALVPVGPIARALEATDLSILVGILDAHGARWNYSATINPTSSTRRVFRAGPILETLEFYGRLAAQDPAAPFAELLGFSLWLTWTAGEDVVLATLSLDSGRVAPALPDLDLVGLELQVPDGIELEHLGPELAAGPPIDVAGGWAHPLLVAGTREVWLQRQERAWRFALLRAGNRSRARALLDNAGFAVPAPASGGVDSWSWADRKLCGFLAQGSPAPDLSHLGVGASGVPGSAASLAALQAKLAAGLPVGPGTSTGRLGLFHGWGCPYGGMTGGSEIDQLLGVELAAGAPDPRRLLEYQLRALRNLDRQRIALYAADSRVLALDPLERADGSLPFALFNGGFLKGDGPLGFAAASASWTRPAGGPAHEAQLRAYDRLDEQHLVRFTGPWKVLAALDHDPHALRILALEAELVRGRLWEKAGGNLFATLAQARSRPRNGGPIGRAEGWIADVVGQAWLYRGPVWRKRFRDWASSLLELAQTSPTPAGVFQRNSVAKSIDYAPFNGQYATSQTIEQGIAANGILGLWRASRALDVRRTLIEAASFGLRYAWADGGSDSYQFVAVAPIAWSSPPFGALPAGMFHGIDSWQVQNLLGYGLELATEADDQTALLILRGLVRDWTRNAPDQVAWVRSKGWANIYNRAAILGALQAGL